MEDTAPKCARCPYSYSDRFCNTVDGKFLPLAAIYNIDCYYEYIK